VETVDVINRGNETIRFTIKTGTDVVFIVEKNTPVEK
jgi:mevalonate pyrophosphate decarboxylase